jgi:DNA ligase (NAD+)
MESSKRYNEQFIELMEKLSDIMLKQSEPFRAKAYQKAQQSIMTYPNDIINCEQLNGLPGIGSTIMEKLKEYIETGTLKVIEREKNNPVNILTDVYGIGPKKAEELVKVGIKTIQDLRERQDELLNDIQKIGLKHYEDIQQRIPRAEIQEFEVILNTIFTGLVGKQGGANNKFEIVGSYRRGASNSGDIDIIITGSTGEIYKELVDELVKRKIITHILSRGQSKTLVIAQLPGKNRISRRVDFLYAPPDEFAFAILYFTGSKIFNTIMRQKALDQGYTFNEHGIYHLSQKKKGEKVQKQFDTENDIFEFLGLQYKTPVERKDGRAIQSYMNVGASVKDTVGGSPTSMKGVTYKDVGASVKDTVGGSPTSMKGVTYKDVGVSVKDTVDESPTSMKGVTYKDVGASVKDTVGVSPTSMKAKPKKSKETDSDTDTVELIQKFVKEGIPVLKKLDELQLTKMLQYASKQYYNDTPVMTDNQFDIIKDFTEDKFPSNNAVKEVGAEVERNKVKLPYLMASMDKIKPDTGALTSWKQKYKGPYVLSCKLDGVSGLYTTEGASPKLYTRGNGIIGQDISHLIPYLRLPKTKNIVIRGEFIIPKAVFGEKYQTKFANPRNMVAGIINHKTITESISDLHFVAYEVIKPERKASEQMELLKTLDIESVLHLNLAANNLTNEKLSETLVNWRNKYSYEIDGVIVTDDKIYPRKTSGNPEHAFAFKMVLSDQIAEAIVVDVIWTPSKDGYLKPRVQIEPINLGGVKIEYATGFNAAFIKDNNVGIGATIQLIRSGDVIPHIKSITVPASEPKMPDVNYKWNDSHVDIMLEDMLSDPVVKEKNITGFFKGIEVEGLGSGNVARMVDAGYDTVAKIIAMTEEDFLKVEGFKQKMASKIYTGIKEKLDEASLVTIMSASNIFGRGFSDKKLELILSEIPDILTTTKYKTNKEKVAAVEEVKGMASKTAEAFVSKIDDFKDFMMETGLSYKMNEKKKTIHVNKNHPLFNKTVVLTGTREKQVVEFLKGVGAIQGASVSKNTDLVVAKTKEDDTGKAEEARKLNIPIMGVDEFIKKYITNK